MKHKMRFTVLSTALFLTTSTSAFAGTATSGDYLRDIGTKFGRGLGNIVMSPGEIPCRVIDDRQERKVGGFFTGIGKGTVHMLHRLFVGVNEVITFMIPMEATLPPLCQVDHQEVKS